MSNKSNEDRVRNYIENSSRSISDIVRLLSVGYLIIYFFSITEENVANALSNYKIEIFLVGLTGIVCLFLDYLNNFLRLKSSFEAFRDPNFEYKPESPFFRFADILFWAKQVVCLAGSLVLIWIFVLFNLAQISTI